MARPGKGENHCVNKTTPMTGVWASGSSHPDGPSGCRVPESEWGWDTELQSLGGLPAPQALCTFILHMSSSYALRPKGDYGMFQALEVILEALGSAHSAGPGGMSCRWNQDHQVFILFRKSASKSHCWQKQRVLATAGLYPGNEVEYQTAVQML